MVSATPLLTLVTLAALGALPRVTAATWTNEAVLAVDGSVRIKWRIHDGNITCQLEANTLGWVGFGLSPNGAMKNSDMIVAGVKDGQPYLTDMHTGDSYQLQVDKRHDCHLVSAWENSTSTVVVFTRPLSPSCQPGHVPGEDRDVTADTQHVLYAWHADDPDRADQPPRHQQRGTRSVHLTDPASGQPPAEPAQGPLPTWRVTQLDAALPQEDTVYWCTVVRAPRLETKHHVIQYHPVITPGHEQVVHHMLLYQCTGHDFSELEEHADVPGGYRCYSANMPPVARGCRGVIAAWGIGGQDFVFPAEAGYPISPDDGAEFYILETHYDLGNRAGLVDSSGLEFTLTPALRKQDASMMILGHDISQLQVVPPRQSELVVAAHCSDECLQLGLPEEGITVFASLPHTHLLGRQIRLRHFRNGKEMLPFIVRDDNYDFNYQQFRHVPPRRLLRGDQLTVECVYSSTERDSVTLGGRSTQEEMCVVFIQYYPAIQLAQCVSTPQSQALLASLGITEARVDGHHNLVVTAPAEGRGLSMQQYTDRLDWTDQQLAALRAASWHGVHEPECYNFGRHVLSTTRNTTGYPAGAPKNAWLTRTAECENTKAAGRPNSGPDRLSSTASLTTAVAITALLCNWAR